MSDNVPFKIGDKVICIDNNNVENQLVVGEEYIIHYIAFNAVVVYPIEDLFSPNRFILHRSSKIGNVLNEI
jgi:hypothetical protein